MSACESVVAGTMVKTCVEFYETGNTPLSSQKSQCEAVAGAKFTEGGACPKPGTIGHCLVTLNFPSGPYAVKGLFYYDQSLFMTFKDSCDMPGAAGSTKTWCGP